MGALLTTQIGDPKERARTAFIGNLLLLGLLGAYEYFHVSGRQSDEENPYPSTLVDLLGLAVLALCFVDTIRTFVKWRRTGSHAVASAG